jgi:hypothetical protein
MINTVEKIYDVLNNQNITYKVTYDNGKISFVPNSQANTDYQAIQKWIAEGNTVIDNGGNI